jgi:hypothetical protein
MSDHGRPFTTFAGLGGPANTAINRRGMIRRAFSSPRSRNSLMTNGEWHTVSHRFPIDHAIIPGNINNLNTRSGICNFVSTAYAVASEGPTDHSTGLRDDEMGHSKMKRIKASLMALIIIAITVLIGSVWVATIIADIHGRSDGPEGEITTFEMRDAAPRRDPFEGRSEPGDPGKKR